MKTVYLFGAGASAGYEGSYIAESSPVAKNFFQKAVKVIPLRKISGHSFEDDRTSYRHLFSFINDFWGINLDNLKNNLWQNIDLDMEEVLTLLHVELEENKNDTSLQKAYHEYMRLMTLTFEKILYGPLCPHHQKIANFLSPNDVVISFNYELLIDNALLHSGKWHPQDGYGIDCNIIGIENFLSTTTQKSSVKLLKLHGSFNWLYCTKCQKLFISLEKDKIGYRFATDSSHLFSISPDLPRHSWQKIIIPPSMIKDYHIMPFTRLLWTQARQSLAKADHIVIIGYSFPPADYRTRWLFRKAIFESKVKQRKITLVNHAQGEKLSSLIKLCSSLLRTTDIITYPNIKKFAKNIR